MAVQKKKRPEPSCPLWLATYGDMVTNMLVFFVLLLSMSEIKEEKRFIEFMEAVREAFGYIGGTQHIPTDQPLDVKNVDLKQVFVMPIDPHDLSPSPDEGIRHEHHNVQAIRRGDYFALGGKLYFDALTAELSPANEAKIAEYAEQIRGYRTQIEIRGHCSRAPVAEAPFADHFALSYARAHAVAAAFVRHGVERERLIIAAAGANEPVIHGAYTAAQLHENDRVEMYQISKRVEEFFDEDAAPDERDGPGSDTTAGTADAGPPPTVNTGERGEGAQEVGVAGMADEGTVASGHSPPDNSP